MSTLDDRAPSLLATPSLEALAYALRHPETWPEGFEWNYGCCNCCAMGMAIDLWGLDVPEGDTDDWSDAVADVVRMNRIDALGIFAKLAGNTTAPSADFDVAAARITPAIVADAIDAYLARQ